MSPRKTVSLVALSAMAAMLSACSTITPAPLAANEATPLERCQQITGSRIHTDRANCEPVGYNYKSFSREDLESTGQVDLVEALRQLNPAFR